MKDLPQSMFVGCKFATSFKLTVIAISRAVVKEHTVTWDIQFQLEPTIIIGKDGVLLPCELLLYIKQTVNAGKSSEDVGMVSINLAEFAASRSTSRRYLLQESRVNSTLRVTIDMKLLKGGKCGK